MLNGSFFNISASQVAESSGRAWEFAGNDYNDTISAQRLQTALLSKGALTPFQDGAGWEGVFNLPVCDVGYRPKWVNDYDDLVLPCCCGVGCRDTKDFVSAANLNGSKSWLHNCEYHLMGTDLDGTEIDYGLGK